MSLRFCCERVSAQASEDPRCCGLTSSWVCRSRTLRPLNYFRQPHSPNSPIHVDPAEVTLPPPEYVTIEQDFANDVFMARIISPSQRGLYPRRTGTLPFPRPECPPRLHLAHTGPEQGELNNDNRPYFSKWSICPTEPWS